LPNSHSVSRRSCRLHTVARVERRRSLAVGSPKGQRRSVVAPVGLDQYEAEALTLVLTEEEQIRAIERTGLSAEGAKGDGEELRRRASIALQHPQAALVEADAAPADLLHLQLKARESALSALRAVQEETEEGLQETIVEEGAADDAQEADEVEVDEEVIFGGHAWAASMLDEFMLTPGKYEAELTESEWQVQLLMMFNADREEHHLPPLDRVTTEFFNEAQVALHHKTPSNDETVAASEMPQTLEKKSSLAWAIWEENIDQANASSKVNSAASSLGASAEEERKRAYDAFFVALPENAKEMLHDLYEMGVLSPNDSIERQARYTKAVALAAERKAEKKDKQKGKANDENADAKDVRSQRAQAATARAKRRRASLRGRS
jgi:hypothetical protein